MTRFTSGPNVDLKSLLSRLLKSQTNRTTGPPGVNYDGLRFPRKSNRWQTYLSVKEDDTVMGKAKSAVKMEKLGDVLRDKTTNRQTAFKITIEGHC